MTIIPHNFNRFVKKSSDKLLWKLPLYEVLTGVDAEYVQRPNRPNLMISTQIAFSGSEDDCLFLEHPSLGLGLEPTWKGECLLSTALGVSEAPRVKTPDGYLLHHSMMYFVPTDVLAGMFRDYDMCLFIQRHLVQDVRLRIQTETKSNNDILGLPIYLDTPEGILQYVLHVLDLAKLLSGQSLADTAAAFGLPFESKNLMDKYKSNMLIPYKSTHVPEDDSESLHTQFVRYGKGDPCILFPLRDKALERTKVLYDQHSLTYPKKEYFTTGALVNSLGFAYFDKVIGDHKAYELFQKKDAKGNVHPYNLEDIIKKSSVDFFARKEESSKQVLGLVQGGLAKNMRPCVISQTGVIADDDIGSAYATLQMLLTYPIGLPSVYSQHESSNKKMFLGQFLKEYKGCLARRLYMIVVEGSLSFSQSLIASKLIETFEIAKVYDPDNPKIPSDFRLFQNEIKNGVITSDVLEVFETRCSNKEWSELMKLEVKAAIWFHPENRFDNSKDWYEAVKQWKEETDNSVVTVTDKNGVERVVDRRSRHWLAVPLKDYLTPYARKRKELKTAMKACKEGSVEHLNLDAQQNALKLVPNAGYGVMASPLLPISTVLIANVITAACRVALWCHNTALGAVQGITDGGGYDVNKVRFWEGSAPSMNTLSLWRNKELLGRKVTSNLREAPLGGGDPWTIEPSNLGDDWTFMSNGVHKFHINSDGKMLEEDGKTATNILNDLVKEHVIDFFRNPNRGEGVSLLPLINFEHKDVYKAASYQSQTNYAFFKVSGAEKMKARGHKVKYTPYNGETEEANIKQLLRDLLKTPTRIPPYKPQTITQILKANMANRMLSSSKSNPVKLNKLLAGDTVLKRSWISSPISMSMFCWKNQEQYESWSKKHEKLKAQNGWGICQYYLNEDGGTLNYEKAVNEIQAAIDDGAMWILPLNKKLEVLHVHPYKEMADKMSALCAGDVDDDDEDELN